MKRPWVASYTAAVPGPPDVSVIVPVNGRHEYVRDAVRSVQGQSLGTFELLLCDDDAEPATREVIEAAARSDSRIRVLPRGDRPKGGCARRNDGVRAANGRYLVFLDCDDVLRIDCLRDRVAWMDRRPELAFGVSSCCVFFEIPGDTPYAFNVLSREPDLERFVRHDFPWQTAAPTWRAEAFARTGGWNESLPSWQDWDLHVRVLLDGMPYALTRLVDYDYRQREGVAYQGLVAVDHLRSRRGVLGGIASRMHAAGLQGTRSMRLLGALYFDVAWRLVCNGFVDEGLALWNDAIGVGLVAAAEHREGVVMLKLARGAPLRPALLLARFRHWPEDLHHTPSETLLRTWAMPFGRQPPRDGA